MRVIQTLVALLALTSILGVNRAQPFFGDFRYFPFQNGLAESVCEYAPSSIPEFGADRFKLGDGNNPPRRCPYRETTNLTVMSDNVTVLGGIGWCGCYNYPVDIVSSIVLDGLNNQYSLYLTMPLAWCVNSSIYAGVNLRRRVDNWHPSGLLYNRRPLSFINASRAGCGSNYNTTLAPPRSNAFPLWDEGGYYYRTVTLDIDDKCQFGFVGHAKIRYALRADNASYFDTGAAALLNMTAPDTWVWWSDTVRTSGGAFLESSSTCKSDCDNTFTIRCNDPVRRRPREVFPVRVELACRDSTFGYLWRVVSESGVPNLHMDWEIVRTRTNTTVRVLPRSSSQVVLPSSPFDPEMLDRLPYLASNRTFDDALFGYDLWPNATLKHGSSANSFFYIPTFRDANESAPALGVERPSLLRLYAGRPGHYEGTVVLGALVAFFDMETLLNLEAMRNASVLDTTSIDARTAFPADRTRQTLLELCVNASALAVAETFMPSNATNLTHLCRSVVLNATALWSDALLVVRDNFYEALGLGSINATLLDPVGQCTCADTGRSPCERTNVNPLNKPRLVYDYTSFNNNPNAPINLTVRPVCRWTTNLPVNNLPPPPNLTTTAGLWVAEVGNALPSFFSRLIPPVSTEVLTSGEIYVNYSVGPVGVLWRIDNNGNPDADPPIPVRWEVAQVNNSLVTVGYQSSSSTDVSLSPGRSVWLFSRTNAAHKVYGNARYFCLNASQCRPTDPPLAGISPINTFFAEITQSEVAALPSCACYVNAPCANSLFLFTTNVSVDVASLPPPLSSGPGGGGGGPPPVAPFNYTFNSNCTPYPEICNNLDDNCNGAIDDVPGIGEECRTPFAQGICASQPGILACVYTNVINETTNEKNGTLQCTGQVQPQPEQCGSIDYDCDGIAGNVATLGTPCGSNVGACRRGNWTCVPPNPQPLCVGGVDPFPFDICGNGIDDDCNGMIDDGCGGPIPPASPSPIGEAPSSPSPSPVPSSTTIPSPTASPPTPSPTPDPGALIDSVLDWLIEQIALFFGADPLTFGFGVGAIFLAVNIVVLVGVLYVLVLCRSQTYYFYPPPARTKSD